MARVSEATNTVTYIFTFMYTFTQLYTQTHARTPCNEYMEYVGGVLTTGRDRVYFAIILRTCSTRDSI